MVIYRAMLVEPNRADPKVRAPAITAVRVHTCAQGLPQAHIEPRSAVIYICAYTLPSASTETEVSTCPQGLLQYLSSRTWHPLQWSRISTGYSFLPMDLVTFHPPSRPARHGTFFSHFPHTNRDNFVYACCALGVCAGCSQEFQTVILSKRETVVQVPT